jgi:pimeloyl-ACP methyl ester carboxylesterase
METAVAGKEKTGHSKERGGITASLSSGVSVYYKDEWLGAPWLDSEPVVFLHGNLETNEIWYGWVPQMGQHYRLLRPDLPGFGGSTAPANFEWSLAGFAKFVADFLDSLGIRSAHIVGAKTGGAIAMQFAATYPQRTRSVVVASGPFTALPEGRAELPKGKAWLSGHSGGNRIFRQDAGRHAPGNKTADGNSAWFDQRGKSSSANCRANLDHHLRSKRLANGGYGFALQIKNSECKIAGP